jgi:hypothetical protein
MAGKLYSGEVFPSLSISLTDGRSVTVPADLGGDYRIILFYRGHW